MRNERGVALAIVLAALVCLLAIGIPFALSMRHEQSAATLHLHRRDARVEAEMLRDLQVSHLVRTAPGEDATPWVDDASERDLDLDQVLEVYEKSTLGDRRPVESRGIFRDMIRHADLIVTARDGSHLVGISRTLTDFSYVAYLADLAVHKDYQGKGIGRELVKRTRENLKDSCFITLLAAPQADDYYGKIGFERNSRAWIWDPAKESEA